jgi:hypothetical protein
MYGARGLFGIHISFKHPFGKHSFLGGAARTVAKVAPFVPFPGLSTVTALVGKAKALGRAVRGVGTALRVNTALPGGFAASTAAQPAQRAHRTRRAAARAPRGRSLRQARKRARRR